VRVGLIRDGRQQTITAVLGELPGTPIVAAAQPDDDVEFDPVFEGADVVDNSSGVAGLLVTSVAPESPASERGLRTGDVITHVNRRRVRNVGEATELMANARSIILQVQRGNRNQLILMR
jgi:serine protease Do